ncbi:hypothetical protein C8R43DRAFT_962374 [Mycena crocata]|nr:hypothetical protein C8R43DRAFT_962374 [Mycena crocata]
MKILIQTIISSNTTLHCIRYRWVALYIIYIKLNPLSPLDKAPLAFYVNDINHKAPEVIEKEVGKDRRCEREAGPEGSNPANLKAKLGEKNLEGGVTAAWNNVGNVGGKRTSILTKDASVAAAIVSLLDHPDWCGENRNKVDPNSIIMFDAAPKTNWSGWHLCFELSQRGNPAIQGLTKSRSDVFLDLWKTGFPITLEIAPPGFKTEPEGLRPAGPPCGASSPALRSGVVFSRLQPSH